jgi:hypothetical protein
MENMLSIRSWANLDRFLSVFFVYIFCLVPPEKSSRVLLSIRYAVPAAIAMTGRRFYRWEVELNQDFDQEMLEAESRS